MYKTLLKYYLRHNSPAKAFRIATDVLTAVRRFPFGRQLVRMRYKNGLRADRKRNIFGLEFSNPVGLAASIDTEGTLYNMLSDFGFSFIEIGPMSYVAQDCNTPICYHCGVKKAIEHLRCDKPDCIIAGNIARSLQSKGADIIKDYEETFALLYDFVDMIVINPGCTTTETTEDRQDKENGITYLPDVIDRLMTMRLYYDSNKPVLVRITPEISRSQTEELIECCLSSGIDGIVAGSTLRKDDDGDGSALRARNVEFIRYIDEKSHGLLPIIGVGGVMNGSHAQEMIDAGASLIEVYTGFFREGPSIVKNIVNSIKE